MSLTPIPLSPPVMIVSHMNSSLIVYLEDYDLSLARLITSGVDLWPNTPVPPLEASGTSGMKAALNGIPSLSILDGWWIEGHIEEVTGWSIGANESEAEEAQELYEKLARLILPLYYHDRQRFGISLQIRFFQFLGRPPLLRSSVFPDDRRSETTEILFIGLILNPS